MPTRGPLGLPRLDPEERRAAIEAPGPSWRAWFFGSFLKVYLGLALLILDVLLLSGFVEAGLLSVGLALLLPALYLDYLLYEFLWYEPAPRPRRSSSTPGSGPFGPRPRGALRLLHPFAFGRWSEAAGRRRATGSAVEPPTGPDPGEFL